MNRFTLFVVMVLFGIAATAQTVKPVKHKKHKKRTHVVKHKTQTLEEKKKAAIKRTLKEKNFHLPDTSGRSKH